MKKLFAFAALFVGLSFISSASLAQEKPPLASQELAQAESIQGTSPCSELLQHGLYDHLRQAVSNTSASQIQSEVCSAYNRLQQDKISGSVSASYKIFNGSASFSREQLEIVGQVTCSSYSGQFYDDSKLTLVSDTISAAAITAYRECIQLNSAGLKSNTIFRESDQAQVTLALRYVAPTGTQTGITIDRVVVSPANAFTCTGTLWDLQGKPNALGTQEVAISCERAMGSQQTPGATIAGAATITVMSQVGTVNRNFMPVVIPTPPPPPPPPPPSTNNGPIYIADGKVGIKTPNPTTDFHLQGDMLINGRFTGLRTTGSGHAIIGETTSQSGGIGIYGRSPSSTGAVFGVQGDTSSPDGGGVVGINLATSGNGFGLAGETRSPSAASLVLLSAGGGDLIRAQNKNGTIVFKVTSDGSIYVRGKKVY
jgi:hypothetical protein